MTAQPTKRRRIENATNGESEYSSENSSDGEHEDEDEQIQTQERGRKKRIATGHGGFGLNNAFAGEVYKSNLFKIQVDELLGQVKPNLSDVENEIAAQLRKVKAAIEAIPDGEPISIHEAKKHFLKHERIAIPFPDPMPDLDPNYKLQFVKPIHINAVGSYPLKTMVQSVDEITIDMVITMPSTIFQEKDYLNCRYLCKRAYYLSCIAAAIQSKSGDLQQISFELLHGNDNLPSLILESTESKEQVKKSGKYWRLRIFPAVQENTFKTEKLLPSKCCIRFGDDAGRRRTGPTALYNGSLMADSLVTSYQKLEFDTLQSCAAFRDACLLGQIWLRQRGFTSRMEDGGFGNFEWSVLTSLLLKGGGSKNTPLFSLGYSSYQLFKAMLQYFASNDLMKVPQTFGNNQIHPRTKDFGQPFFFDQDRSHNILYKMAPWAYGLLKHEAKISLAALNDIAIDQFQSTFIYRTDYPLCRYDAQVELTIPTRPDMWITFQKLYQTFQTGLNNRIQSLNFKIPRTENWAIKSEPEHSATKISVGFLFDPVHIYRTVDHGPPAEAKKESAEFRSFWGEKSELRRFRDGRILESVVWASNSKTSVFRQILSYCLLRHFGTEFEASYHEDQTVHFLSSPEPQPQNSSFQTPILALQELEREIRDLDGLPLHLRLLQPASSQLSYSSLKSPGQQGKFEVMEVIIQFEGSARWPDDMIAIQRTKIAFLLKLGDLLEESTKIPKLICKVGLENEESSLHNQAFLDISYPTGMTFRFRIHHDREIALLERRLNEKTQGPQEKLEIASALANYKRTFVRGPHQTQAIQALAIKYPSFTQTVRLLKKWFASHLLSPHFSTMLIELFAARVYTNPYPWSVPCSGTVGLLRTLLMLSRWDWKHEPWISNLGSENMTELEVSAIQTRFEAWRKIDPALNRVVLFAASNIDVDGTTWTDHGQPPKVIAARMSALARSAVELIKAQKSKVQLNILFASNLSDYDFIIRIADNFDLGKQTSLQSGFKNLQLQAMTNKTLIGLDPFSNFVHELIELYGNSVLFFYDEDHKDAIAGLWNPQTRRSWKLKLGYSSVPISILRSSKNGSIVAKDDIEINRDAILNEICRLGRAMVRGIDRK